MDEFYRYVLSYYGPYGLYPMGVTLGDVKAATEIYKSRIHTTGFVGDSMDREEVRDILIAMFGYEWPEPETA
jgi:hypothetical protein